MKSDKKTTARATYSAPTVLRLLCLAFTQPHAQHALPVADERN